jgi:hypothetical protein
MGDRLAMTVVVLWHRQLKEKLVQSATAFFKSPSPWNDEPVAT